MGSSRLRADTSEVDKEMGVKRLTLQNWLERDPVLDNFVQLTVMGPRTMTTQEWADRFLSVELSTSVPMDVRRLFVVARAVFLYGAFFYPLYGLAEERLFILADAALGHRYLADGGPLTNRGRWPTYGRRINWLKARGRLSIADAERWTALRELRNLAAHPADQSITPPGVALQMLVAVAEDVSGLFS